MSAKARRKRRERTGEISITRLNNRTDFYCQNMYISICLLFTFCNSAKLRSASFTNPVLEREERCLSHTVLDDERGVKYVEGVLEKMTTNYSARKISPTRQVFSCTPSSLAACLF